MTMTVHRMFATLVLALVAALIMPMAAGAAVLPVERAVVDEHAEIEVEGVLGDESLEPHDPEGEWAVPEGDIGSGIEDAVEIEIPREDGVSEVDAPDTLRPEQGEDPREQASEGDVDPEEPVEGDPLEEEREQSAMTAAEIGAETHISAGRHHVLYLDDDGQIWSWGRNDVGQLGNGTTVDSSFPVRVDMTGVLAGVEIVAVSAGLHHNLALSAEGHVYSWGRNTHGELGDGSRTNRATPVRVGGLLATQPVVKIDADGIVDGNTESGSVALGANGRVYTWGSGYQGRLGNGTTTVAQTTPVLVGGLIAGLRISDVAASSRGALAVDSDGRVFSWGTRSSGAMGDGGPAGTVAQSVPVAVTMSGAMSGARIVQVVGGNNNATVLSDDGRIFSWGMGVWGIRGDGLTANATVPVRVDMAAFEAIGGVGAVQIAGSVSTRIALGANGRVAAWGAGARGQLGDGANVQAQSRPVPVSVAGVMGDASIIQISNGGGISVALAEDGRVFTWG